MADLAEVEQQFFTIIAAALQMPGGYGTYNVATSALIGSSMRIYRGWPLDAQLGTDLSNGVSNVSIFSAQGLARDTTRFLRRMTQVVTAVDTPSMTATVSGKTVTFAGTTSIHECIGIADGSQGYAYRLMGGDTPTTVAATFAANIAGATSVGAVLTLNTTHLITATYGADVTTLTEVHRQEQLIRVSVWTPTTLLRDQICAALDPAIQWNDRILFEENSISGPIRSAGTHVDDCVGIEAMWRRDLLYKIEYATNYLRIEPPFVLFEQTGTITNFE